MSSSEHPHIRSTDVPEDEEIIILRRRLDRHIDEYRLYVLEADKRDDRLAEKIDKLVDSTQGLVDSWTFVNNFRRFILWASAFTLPAGAVYTKIKGWW